MKLVTCPARSVPWRRRWTPRWASPPRAVLGGTTTSKRAAAITLRPALEGRWADALTKIDADTEIGNLGATSRGHHLGALEVQLAQLGAPVESWRGVRIATDHLRDTPADEQIDDVTGPGDSNRNLAVEVEWQLGGRDPYRHVARLLHLICRRDPTGAA